MAKYILSILFSLAVVSFVLAGPQHHHPGNHPGPHPSHPAPHVPPHQPSGHYYVNHGHQFSHGWYYTGRHHCHWSYHYWYVSFGCWIYYDPDLYCWYYFCVPLDCYYPISYCPYSTYSWVGDDFSNPNVDPISD